MILSEPCCFAAVLRGLKSDCSFTKLMILKIFIAWQVVSMKCQIYKLNIQLIEAMCGAVFRRHDVWGREVTPLFFLTPSLA